MKHMTVYDKLRFYVITLFLSGLAFSACNSSPGNTVDETDDERQSEEDSTQSGGGIVDKYAPTLFTVIGDVPYNDEQKIGLTALIATHNEKADSEFIVHIGDIKPGADPCDEAVYEDISGMLKKFDTPTFMLLGDNEYNDCNDPDEALEFWNQYFLHFSENWEFDQEVVYQEERIENFAWMQEGVLFLGLNLVGSSVHDQAEWDKRMGEDADWLEEQLKLHGENIGALVVTGHANMTEIGPEKFAPFTDRFRASAQAFAKPVLYLHGDGHFWFQNRPWPEQNILRVQIEGGANAVQVTVDPDLEDPFAFDRTFLD